MKKYFLLLGLALVFPLLTMACEDRNNVGESVEEAGEGASQAVEETGENVREAVE